MTLPCWWVGHKWREWYSGFRPDGPNGERTVQCIHWTCERCGKTEGMKQIPLFLVSID